MPACQRAHDGSAVVAAKLGEVACYILMQLGRALGEVACGDREFPLTRRSAFTSPPIRRSVITTMSRHPCSLPLQVSRSTASGRTWKVAQNALYQGALRRKGVLTERPAAPRPELELIGSRRRGARRST